MEHLEIAGWIETNQSQIMNDILATTLQNPFWFERFGERVSENIIRDTTYNLETIARAIRYKSPMIFDDYFLWLRRTLVSLRVSTGLVRETLAVLWRHLAAHVPQEGHQIIYEYIESANEKLSYVNPAAKQLYTAHGTLAEEITKRSYDNHWHWQTAYGHQGRQRALYENWLTIDYVLDTLDAGDDHVLMRHMCWMRDQGIRRGLSTLHMQQLLWHIASSSEQHLTPELLHDVRRVLQVASGSLLPQDNQALQALMSVQGAIVNEAAHHLVNQGLAQRPEAAATEIGWYLAYINDGLAENDPSILIGYTRWMQHWLSRNGASPSILHQNYAALKDAVNRSVPTHALQQVVNIIDSAQRSL